MCNMIVKVLFRGSQYTKKTPKNSRLQGLNPVVIHQMPMQEWCTGAIRLLLYLRLDVRYLLKFDIRDLERILNSVMGDVMEVQDQIKISWKKGKIWVRTR